jgi:hypothetical protein
MRSVIVAGLLVAAIIILVRVIMGTPFIKSVRSSVEGFQDASSASLALPLCPFGSTLYMYDGAAYCCSGIINGNADTVQQSCIRPLAKQGDEPVFCTMGPGQAGIPNCTELMVDFAEQAAIGTCPSAMPNFVYKANGSSQCCSVPADSNGNCGGSSCSVIADEFTSDTNCRFLREKEVQSCPSSFQTATVQGQGQLAGLTLYGCSDQNQVCYSQAMVARLGELGYDASALSVCGSS